MIKYTKVNGRGKTFLWQRQVDVNFIEAHF